MFDEARRRDPDDVAKRRWVVLADGEPRQLRAVKAEARRAGVKVTILLDVVHVLEYVWKAARALFGGSNPKAEKWVGERLLALPRAAQRSKRRSGDRHDSLAGRPKQARCIGARRHRERVRPRR